MSLLFHDSPAIRFVRRTGAAAFFLTALFATAAAGGDSRLELTMEEAVELAIRHNLSLEAERLTPRVAAEDLRIEEAAFDPFIDLSGTRTHRLRGTAASQLDGASQPRTDTLVTRGAVSKLIESGAVISLESRLVRTESNSANALLNPAYDSELSANIRQPLLRGRGQAATAGRDRARIGRRLADIEFQATLMDVIHATEIAYLRLALARDEWQLRRFSLDLAESFLEEVEFRREAGAADALDVLRAEVSLADRREAGVEAEQLVLDRRDDLLNLIGRRDDPAAYDLELVTRLPPPPPLPGPGMEEALLAMRSQRPEFLFAEEQIAQFEVDLRLARNQRLPSLDVGGGVGYTGLDGSPGRSIENLAERGGYFWRGEIVFSMPWGLRGERARYRRAGLLLEREISRMAVLKQDLLVETRTNLRAVSTAAERLDLATRFTGAGERQFEMEQERFRAGVSTTRNVLDAQAELEEARLREIRARLLLHEAEARLRRTLGESPQPYETVDFADR